jgi:hypothetical protein
LPNDSEILSGFSGVPKLMQLGAEVTRIGKLGNTASVDRKLMMTRVNIQRGQGENVAQSPGE